ncbi:MAG: PhzF family phenazine biosynthesis protein [Janthinobacterium lividum]
MSKKSARPGVFSESDTRFRVRNTFAYGGVYEDPATGAAAAAFAGYMRALGWPCSGGIEILQGVEMGMPSRIRAGIPETSGSSIRISGTVRVLPSK